MICKNCGIEIDDNNNFCHKCGKSTKDNNKKFKILNTFLFIICTILTYKITLNHKDYAICDTRITTDGTLQAQIKDYYFRSEVRLYNHGDIQTFYVPNISSLLFAGMLVIAILYIAINKCLQRKQKSGVTKL